jgi:phospholipid-transporting ATPase
VLDGSLMEYIDLASKEVKEDKQNIITKDDIKKSQLTDLNERLETFHDIYVKKQRKLTKKLFLIIDGINLEYVLIDKELSKKFFEVGLLASSVICCRVSPLQKSLVVKLAKENGSWITLSIGDGANDVPMIMEAHIGIGIQGKEGTQVY